MHYILTQENEMTKQYILIYKDTNQVYSDAISYDEALTIKNNNANLEMVEFVAKPKANIDYSVLDTY
jgi:hypothetical protein